MSYLVVFLFVYAVFELAEIWLKYLNYQYVSCQDRQKSCQKVLGISEDNLQKSYAYFKDHYYFSLLKKSLYLVCFILFTS